MAQSENEWGRVDADGTVFVKDGEWRGVGQVVDATPTEALAFYEARFVDLESQVSLLEQRAKAGASAKDLLTTIHELVVKLTEAHAVGDLASLRLRVGVVADSIEGLKAQQDEAQREATEQSTERRRAIVARAEAIAASINGSIHWRNAQKEITELLEQWKEEQKLPHRVPKKIHDELWAQFRAARQTFDRAQRAYFHTRHTADKEAKSAKTNLCERAEALESKGAEGIAEYRKLLEEWKRAPRAARALDNQLWDRFKAAGDKLYSAGSAEWSANSEAKTALLSEFEWLKAEKEIDKAKQGFRQLRDKWDRIGHVAKAQERAINDGFRAIERTVRALEAEFLDRTNPAKIALRQGFATQVETAIAELEDRKLKAATPEAIAAIDAEITAKREWLAAIS